MKKVLSGFFALALTLTMVAGCSESPTDRIGERPGDRAPSASPRTTPPPDSTTTTPPAAAPSTETPPPTTPPPSGAGK